MRPHVIRPGLRPKGDDDLIRDQTDIAASTRWRLPSARRLISLQDWPGDNERSVAERCARYSSISAAILCGRRWPATAAIAALLRSIDVFPVAGACTAEKSLRTVLRSLRNDTLALSDHGGETQ